MKKIILLLIIMTTGLTIACRKGPQGKKCGTCPDFDRKEYKRKTR